MADIFLARDRVLERSVVIKMLLPQYADDPAFVERFRREATSAAKLNHKNVVAVYDWGSHEDTFYMGMEYIDGQSLAELLVASPKLPVETALAITSEAAAGLGFAHANGMVHRDVKPGNIMLTKSGEVKVADFGIARALDGGEGLTQTGNVMGTAAYFSPEQARGESVDRRSDMYSLGVVLFEMVTGQRPFTGSSPVSVAYKHVGEAPPLPTTIDTSLPPAIDTVLDHLLAKDPDDRYADADELRAELQRISAGQALLGPATARHRAAAPVPQTRQPSSNHAVPQSAEATAMMQGASPAPLQHNEATAMLAPERRPDRRPPTAPVKRRSSGSGFFVMALAALVVAAIVLLVVIGTTLTGDATGGDAETDTDQTPSLPAGGSSTSTPSSTVPPTTGESSTSEAETSSTTDATSTSTTSTTAPPTTNQPTTASTSAPTTSTTEASTTVPSSETTTEGTTETPDDPTTTS
jgi:serine/threonine-protein kinase